MVSNTTVSSLAKQTENDPMDLPLGTFSREFEKRRVEGRMRDGEIGIQTVVN